MKPGEKIRMARLAKRLSQQAIADILGVKQQAVSEWENGGGVDQKHWPEIKEHLGVDLSGSISQYSPTRSSAILDPHEWAFIQAYRAAGRDKAFLGSCTEKLKRLPYTKKPKK